MQIQYHRDIEDILDQYSLLKKSKITAEIGDRKGKKMEYRISKDVAMDFSPPAKKKFNGDKISVAKEKGK